MMELRLSFLVLLIPALACAQGGNDTVDEETKPLLIWRFDGAKEAGSIDLKNREPGPRTPIYPAFIASNSAYAFTGKKSGILVREKEIPKANLRFTNGDAITLESWVRIGRIQPGNYDYVIGKGRTHLNGFPDKNQNYALRLKGDSKDTKISFLFASAGMGGDWHRWTSKTGITVDNGWHHVAITYLFGKPDSIRGYIDGKVVTGSWDMGGATTKAPVTDGDDLLLGNGNGTNNAFQGWLDEVAIWRSALPASTLTARYQFVPPPPAIQKADLPRGHVLMQICEGDTPLHNWPVETLKPTETYREEAFGFFELPQRYIDTGVRADRTFPFLLRAGAVVSLPPGKHRLLLRGRGASRLIVDGKTLLTTPFPSGDGSGHGSIRKPESYLDLGTDFRFAPPGNREAWITFESNGGEHAVLLETIVGSFLGNSRRRPELGETVVAISLQGSDSWQLLNPGERRVTYNDAGWEAYAQERTAWLDKVNSDARTKARQQNQRYWNRRRELAQEWLKQSTEVVAPKLPKDFPANNPIDLFVGSKIQEVIEAETGSQKGTVDYFKQVQPLLESKCYSCHSGNKAKGKLALDDRTALTHAAIIKGKPAQSELIARLKAEDENEVMPPKGDRLTKEQIELLSKWIEEGAHWPQARLDQTHLTPLTDDLTFLRRVTLDTVGVVPTLEEITAFKEDRSEKRREKVVDRLLNDPRWADHQMGYWQDVLAENPNILNPTLNNTGPFRWWLLESFRDNKPMDLFVTELIRMRGSERFGGPAGFAVSSQNDVPMAAKGSIVASAFLGIEMKCARCHDAPSHISLQRDLFELAALLAKKPLTVPTTSSVPNDKLHKEGRKALIQVTLKPGATVEPRWPFERIINESISKELAENPEEPRDRLAALITAPQNERFAQVVANRVWQRLMGRGLIEPAGDWEKGKLIHPELLKWLGRELVRSGYDQKHLMRLILNSHAYQRQIDPALSERGTLFAAPASRRLTAEQIVDSLFAASSKKFEVEEMSLDIDSIRDLGNSITLGHPNRSWMFASTSNERDRPSLSLPRNQMVIDVLTAFGWRPSRQEPQSERDSSPNAIQPAILANGTVGLWLTRLSDDHGITVLALQEQTLDRFLDTLFLRYLTRLPSPEERARYAVHLKEGFDKRVLPPTSQVKKPHRPIPYVSWSNHLSPEANLIRQQQEQEARLGNPPTQRLESNWRNRLEDVLWGLMNSPEMIFVP
jgi:mono/diheme cytochrome c family protein